MAQNGKRGNLMARGARTELEDRDEAATAVSVMKATRALLLALLSMVNQAEPATAVQLHTFKHLLAILARQAKNPDCDMSVQVLKPEESDAIVKQHNEIRSSVASGKVAKFPSATDMNALEWDDKLSKQALATAEYCDPTREGKDEDLKPPEGDSAGKISQNTGSATVKATDQSSHGIAILENWIKPKDTFDEKLIEKYADPTDAEAKRFAQLIWAKTARVGCGFVRFKLKSQPTEEKDILVCNYAPAGREKDQPIYEKGDACSKCGDGRKCDDTTKLCKSESDLAKEKQSEGGSSLAVLGIVAAVIAVLVAVVGVCCMRRSGGRAAGAAGGAEGAAAGGGAGDEGIAPEGGSKEANKPDAAEGAGSKEAMAKAEG